MLNIALNTFQNFRSILTSLHSSFPQYEGFTGKSYAKMLKSNENSDQIGLNEYIFAEKDFHDIYDPIRCIRSKTHKLIINYEPQISTVDAVPGDIQNAPTYRSWIKTYPNVDRDHEEFYDLEKDPLETDNIALRDPHHPELVKMRNRLQLFLKDTNDQILTGKITPKFPAKVDNANQFPHLLEVGCYPSPLKKGIQILNKIRKIFSNKKNHRKS